MQIVHFVSADEHWVDPLRSNNSFGITRSMVVHLRSVHHLRRTEYRADSLLHHHLLIFNFIKNTVILQWPKGSRIQSSTSKHEQRTCYESASPMIINFDMLCWRTWMHEYDHWNQNVRNKLKKEYRDLHVHLLFTHINSNVCLTQNHYKKKRTNRNIVYVNSRLLHKWKLVEIFFSQHKQKKKKRKKIFVNVLIFHAATSNDYVG